MISEKILLAMGLPKTINTILWKEQQLDFGSGIQKYNGTLFSENWLVQQILNHFCTVNKNRFSNIFVCKFEWRLWTGLVPFQHDWTHFHINFCIMHPVHKGLDQFGTKKKKYNHQPLICVQTCCWAVLKTFFVKNGPRGKKKETQTCFLINEKTGI